MVNGTAAQLRHGDGRVGMLHAINHDRILASTRVNIVGSIATAAPNGNGRFAHTIASAKRRTQGKVQPRCVCRSVAVVAMRAVDVEVRLAAILQRSTVGPCSAGAIRMRVTHLIQKSNLMPMLQLVRRLLTIAIIAIQLPGFWSNRLQGFR